MLFDTSKIDEELIMDKIIHGLPPDDDYFYIEHPKGSNSFTLKREDGRWKKIPSKSKELILKFKNWP